VARAQRTRSRHTVEYEFIVGQTPSYWPSNVQLSHAKRPGSVAPTQRTCSTGEDDVKRPDSVAEAQLTCAMSEDGLVEGQTPSYWPSGEDGLIDYASNAHLLAVKLQLSHVKRPDSVAECRGPMHV